MVINSGELKQLKSFQIIEVIKIWHNIFTFVDRKYNYLLKLLKKYKTNKL